MKRGQLAIFIIIGLLMLVLIGVISYFYSAREGGVIKDDPGRTTSIQDLAGKVNAHVESCVLSTVPLVVWRMASLGGTLSPRKDGGGVFSWSRERVDVWGVESLDKGVVNRARSRIMVADELSRNMMAEPAGLLACLRQLGTTIPGTTITANDPLRINTQLNAADMVLRLNYPITVTVNGVDRKFTEFSVPLKIPFGRMIQIGEDIVNAEARNGFFNKEDYMLRNGGDIFILKGKPYPDTTYSVSVLVTGYPNPFVLLFAVKGLETFNNAIRKPLSPLGCCYTGDSDCRANIESATCELDSGRYDASRCTCQQLAQPVAQGCCKRADLSCTWATGAQGCNGTFYEGDNACKTAINSGACRNLVCNDLAYFYDDKFSAMRQGESWCTMDTVTGFGTDFVGNRHYVHSCLNGIEVVEPCRDYREEICVGEIDPFTGLNHAVCKPNRWYDCAAQNDQKGCEDLGARDCFWMPRMSGAIVKKINVKCVPFVPPGFRFWKGEGAVQCSQGNSGVNKKYPKVQGFNSLHLCSRLGDCGDKRNYVGDISKGNARHPAGKPKTAHYWAYSLAGYHNPVGTPDQLSPLIYFRHYRKQRGILGWIKEVTFEQAASREVGATALPTRKSGSVSCGLWKPLAQNRCELCNIDILNRPCTEYRCRSLGSGCKFVMDRGVGLCDGPAMGTGDRTGPTVDLVTSSLKGFFAETVTTGKSLKRYRLTPAVTGDTLIEFDISSSEKAVCHATSAPQGVDTSLLTTADNSGVPVVTPAQRANVTPGVPGPGEVAEDDDFTLIGGDESSFTIDWTDTKQIAGEILELLSFDITLGNGTLRSTHHVAFVTPPDDMVRGALEVLKAPGFNLTLYFNCNDESDNPSQNELAVTIAIAPSEVNDTTPPQIISANVTNETDEMRLRIAMNEGIEQCRIGFLSDSFDSMTAIQGCAPDPLDLNIDPWAPLGSHVCDVPDIPGEAVSCKDLYGNINEPVEISRPEVTDSGGFG